MTHEDVAKLKNIVTRLTNVRAYCTKKDRLTNLLEYKYAKPISDEDFILASPLFKFTIYQKVKWGDSEMNLSTPMKIRPFRTEERLFVDFGSAENFALWFHCVGQILISIDANPSYINWEHLVSEAGLNTKQLHVS